MSSSPIHMLEVGMNRGDPLFIDSITHLQEQWLVRVCACRMKLLL